MRRPAESPDKSRTPLAGDPSPASRSPWWVTAIVCRLARAPTPQVDTPSRRRRGASAPSRAHARLRAQGPRRHRAAGQRATADFALSQRSIQLDQVVVTGTGGAVERRAVGNVIESINANDVLKTAAPRSVEQLIGARTPGVMVLPATGQVGTGAQIRVRSVGSLSLSTDPIVYIDGVRMDANTSQGPAQRGGAGASRLNDINPEDIESIEIIKGPAAATLYGTEASNGVVQIITKRGSNSAPHWDFTTRQGQNWLANPEGRAGLLWSKERHDGPTRIAQPLSLRDRQRRRGRSSTTAATTATRPTCTAATTSRATTSPRRTMTTSASCPGTGTRSSPGAPTSTSRPTRSFASREASATSATASGWPRTARSTRIRSAISYGAGGASLRRRAASASRRRHCGMTSRITRTTTA